MNKIDEMIGRALTEEDRALLASQSEPGYIAQAFGLFRGPQAWAMWIINIVGALAFFAGAYAIWRVFGTADVLDAVKWGVVSLVLFQATTLCKTLSINRMESNRLLRELKRMELQVSLLRDRAEPARS
jgi:uncharacterized membrane protein